MSLLDNFVSGVVTTGGIQTANALASGQSNSIQTAAPFVGGMLLAYTIGRYQDQNGKMGGIAATGITGVAGALGHTITKKSDRLTSATQVAVTMAVATAANFACEKYLNIA